MSRAAIIRKIFRDHGIVTIAGAHDGLSAKLVEKNGFEGIWASGFEIAASHAVPDANILTMSENLERACEIHNASSIPVIADCDTGFGNSNNVIHMVKKYEAAGIAGVCIEDKHFPKVNSFIEGRQDLASVSEFVGKIMAAKNSQQSKDFLVIARIEALIAGKSIDEAITRARAYTSAGADAILIHSREKTQQQIIDFCKAWKKQSPVVIVPTSYPDFTPLQLKSLGIQMVIYANQGLRAATKAADDVLAHIRKHGKEGLEGRIATMDFIFNLQDMYKMKKDEAKYLLSDGAKTDCLILAAGEPNYQQDLMNLLKDVPPVMLDINGKPLLQRNCEVLHAVGLHSIFAVTGYKSEKINLKDVQKIHNSEYSQTYILNSLLKAKEYLKDRVLLCYGDVMFDQTIIEPLLKSESDIVLAVDPTFKKSENTDEHVLDLVRTQRKARLGMRSFSYGRNPVVEISNTMDRTKADYEFIGIALLSKKGFENLVSEAAKAKQKYKTRKFHSAPNFSKASLADMLSEMIAKGYTVDTLEVHSGWTEIKTFNNYKLACAVTGQNI